jgi:hypothetical protein
MLIVFRDVSWFYGDLNDSIFGAICSREGLARKALSNKSKSGVSGHELCFMGLEAQIKGEFVLFRSFVGLLAVFEMSLCALWAYYFSLSLAGRLMGNIKLISQSS